MTRFLFLSDTHWGAGEEGYRLQPRYTDRLPELLAALAAWIEAHGGIDFILHGGDLVHETDPDAIRAAAAALRLGPPVHLCLGNHDLTAPGALDTWLAVAPELFVDGAPSYTLTPPDAAIHVVPNQYGSTPWRWEETQDPHFLPEQLDVLSAALHAHADRTQLLLTHSPVHPLPPAQTGEAEPFHAPPTAFARSVDELVRAGGVACVLGGHSHANMRQRVGGADYVTASSFAEAPFEFKVFEIDADDGLRMETHNLWNRVGFAADYDWDRTFVQGRAADRAFHRETPS